MKRFKIFTILILWSVTSGQPIPTASSDNVQSINPKDMLKLVRNSMEKSAHTYGMNLSSNIGYVWNNIGYGNPVLHYVGKPEQQENSNSAHKVNATTSTTEKKTPQILEELLNYEEFWRWLSDWTTLYMQALSDYLAKAIRDEVAKEVEMYFNILETGDYIKKMDKINSDRVRDQLYLEVKHKLIEEGLIFYNQNNINTNTELKNEINKAVHDEIEMLKKKKDKDEKRPNQNDKLSVEADKIYGNSVGNEKVVNIYIFNPNTDSNEVIDQLKPTGGAVSGTFTFGPQDSLIINDDKTDKPTDEESDVSGAANI